MAKPIPRPGWQQALIILTSTVVGIALICTLYWAQSILVPVALAIFFTFLLSPAVNAFEKRGMPRVVSVVSVVLIVSLVLGGVIWMTWSQVADLSKDLPKYSDNVKAKIRQFKEMGNGGITSRLERLYLEIMTELDSGSKHSDGINHPETAQPTPVVLEPGRHPWLVHLSNLFGPMVNTLGIAALSLVLVIFMLIKREDLRNRIIRLVGHGHITLTTKALDEASGRISKFLVMQAIVNSSYGVTFAIGLYFAGVAYAPLWGFLAAVLRYIPYLGAWISALFPITLAVAMSNGWMQPIIVISLILILELISNNVIEPSLYGQSMGVSEVALIVSAAFWAFLWGPIGMVLSCPLTVLLVVLGHYVPQFHFLVVLLGDEPALEPDLTFYQRVLAKDEDEAEELAIDYAKNSNLETTFDQIIAPTLTYLKRDRERGDIQEEDVASALEEMQEIIENVSDSEADRSAKAAVAKVNSAKADEAKTGVVKATDAENEEVNPTKVHVLACPARDRIDQVGLEMLAKLMNPKRWEIEVVSVETLTAEVIAKIQEKGPAILCVGSLPPGGLAHTRSFCKRLKRRFPNLKMIVGRWSLKGNIEKNITQLKEAGAEIVTTSLAETRDQLVTWHSVLSTQSKTAPLEPGKTKPMPPTAA